MGDEQTDLSGAASLATTILDEEAARQVAQAAARRDVVFADDLLPGVGSEPLELKTGLRRGGFFTFVLLTALASLDELEAAVITVMGPDIAETFGVSDGTITFISVASVAFFVLGAGPIGWLADRMRRGPIVGLATLLFAGFSIMTGLAVNAFMLFWVRFGAGVSKANTITVHSTLLADAYPIGVRGRVYATNIGLARAFGAVSPMVVGAIAAIAGGDGGWRWPYFLVSLPVAVLGFIAFRLPEPERGRWEKHEVLGAGLDDSDPIEMSVEAAFARIWRIDTIRYMTIALAAMGFALFPAQAIQSFFLEEEFGLDALERGFALAPTGIGLLFFLPFIGKRFDKAFREAPDRALRIMGVVLLPLAVLVPVQYFMPNVALFVVIGTVNGTLLGAAFSMIGPSIQAVVPYRLRGIGTAIITFFMFAVGGIGGGFLSAFLQNEFGERPAIICLTVVSMPVGGWFIIRGARRVRHDLSLLVAELQEEQAEQIRRQNIGKDEIPAIQVSDIDFSYGQVQVLFEMGFEVMRGETLALLGTNGAGKSTILRIIAGLETPERGVVRLNGRTITFATPEQRAAMGIQMLPGGKGIFPGMLVRDNLVIGAYQYRHDQTDVDRRIAKVLELFPTLASREGERAGDLSGGQQQMLALARVMLHEPEVLVIDELSLGLAPVVVQSLLATIDHLKAAGQTMIIVEQSLNVALAVADRAVFLEKGEVRFEGDAEELAQRDDLARAVFLGTEGG